MNPTASAIERAIECPSSCVLPQVHETTDDAARGTSIHAFVRNVLAGIDRTKALAAVEDPKWRATCGAIDFRKIGSDLSDMKAEASYAYDVGDRSVRLLGYNIGRRYGGLRPMEIAGTNDAEGLRIDGIPTVIDVKTGQPVTVCRENPQMMFHSLCRMAATGAQEIDARILYVREDGHVRTDSHVFDVFELESFADELDVLLGQIGRARIALQSGTLTVNSGDHCRYCPALQACPAYTALARSMVPDLEAVQSRIAALSPADAGKAWALLEQVGTLYDTVKDALKVYAAQTPIVLPNGKIVREVSYEREDLNRSSALALLRAKGATDAEIQALYQAHEIKQIRTTGTAKKPAKKKEKAA